MSGTIGPVRVFAGAFAMGMAVLLAGCLRPGGGPAAGPAPEVRVLRVPSGGAVPDALVDARGRIHAVYTRANDVWYATSDDGGRFWGFPARVNADAGTADEPGMFRGPRLSIGRAGRLHVVWYPLRRDRPASEWGIRYAHLGPPATGFSLPLALSREPGDGYSVAAAPDGTVVACWIDEQGLEVARSADGGDTFSLPESIPGADPVRTCATRGLFLPGGEFLLLYRDRGTPARRESVVAWSRGLGVFERRTLSANPWPEDVCPTTGGWLSEGGNRGAADGSPVAAVATWETGEELSWAALDARGRISPAGEIRTMAAGGRWPVVLANAAGQVCVSWKENATLCWEVFGLDGRSLGPVRSQSSPSPHGHAGVVLPDGTFLLIDAGG